MHMVELFWISARRLGCVSEVKMVFLCGLDSFYHFHPGMALSYACHPWAIPLAQAFSWSPGPSMRCTVVIFLHPAWPVSGQSAVCGWVPWVASGQWAAGQLKSCTVMMRSSRQFNVMARQVQDGDIKIFACLWLHHSVRARLSSSIHHNCAHTHLNVAQGQVHLYQSQCPKKKALTLDFLI